MLGELKAKATSWTARQESEGSTGGRIFSHFRTRVGDFQCPGTLPGSLGRHPRAQPIISQPHSVIDYTVTVPTSLRRRCQLSRSGRSSATPTVETLRGLRGLLKSIVAICACRVVGWTCGGAASGRAGPSVSPNDSSNIYPASPVFCSILPLGLLLLLPLTLLSPSPPISQLPPPSNFQPPAPTVSMLNM